MADFYLPNEIWREIFSYLPLAPKKNATATQWYFSMKLVKKFFWIFLSCGNLLSVILYQNALKSSLLVYKWYKNHIMSFKVGLC